MLKLPKDYFTLDFETTGLPQGEDASLVDITEIGYALIKDSVISKVEQSLAKPVDSSGNQVPLTAKIIEITHITDEMLKDKPTSLEVAEKYLKEIVESDLAIVGYNIVGFDRHFINKYVDLLGWQRPENSRYIDAAALIKTYRRAHRNKNTSWELPGFQKQLFTWAQAVLEKSWVQDQVKYNLDAAVGYLAIPQFGIEYDRHRAVFDVILTHRVYEKLREEMSL